MTFDPLRALRVLTDHGVQFVVIGGQAAVAHGSPSVTNDIDICHERSAPNLERLALALRSLNAFPRDWPQDVPFVLDAATLGNGDSFTFDTDAGPLDCIATPAGSRGYEELAATALDIDLDDLRIRIADLHSLIEMKLAAGRPKDRIEAEVLGALRDELDRQTE